METTQFKFDVYLKIEYELKYIDERFVSDPEKIKNLLIKKYSVAYGLQMALFGFFHLKRNYESISIDSNFIYETISIETNENIANKVLEYISDTSRLVSIIDSITIGEVTLYDSTLSFDIKEPEYT